MDYTVTINGHECRFKVTCLKYSRLTQSWVFFAKGFRRKTFPIPGADAESLLRQQTFTRHDKGDEILFQINRNLQFLPARVVADKDFDFESLL